MTLQHRTIVQMTLQHGTSMQQYSMEPACKRHCGMEPECKLFQNLFNSHSDIFCTEFNEGPLKPADQIWTSVESMISSGRGRREFHHYNEEEINHIWLLAIQNQESLEVEFIWWRQDRPECESVVRLRRLQFDVVLIALCNRNQQRLA